MYEKQKVYESTLKYFHGDDLATNVWIDKYCLKDKEGNLMELNPSDMHKRIAKELSRIEQKYPNPLSYDEIYSLLADWTIIPGGSLLYGIGNNYSISSLGNCFVIGGDSDSYGGICQTDQEQVQLMKRRAGVGHDLSHLRASNARVTNAAGTSTGPVSFMPRYSNSTREVAQDGRRGALMLTININHPNAGDFITSKDDLTKITGANISVKVTDKFMRGAEHGMGDMNMINWRKLIHQAWKSAEPGVLFWDKIVSESPADCYKGFKSISTNPCGEIPLCAYDSCRLLSINLTKIVLNPFTHKAEISYDYLRDLAYKAQRLMDDVVDLEEEKINLILDKINNDPEPEEVKAIEKNLWIKIKEKLLQGRRTGLSGIGLADTLAMLNVGYASEKGLELSEEMYKQIAIASYKSSIDMAKDRGAFLIWDIKKEKDNPFINRINETIAKEKNEYFLDTYVSRWLKYGRRNIANLTIPPSGTISLLAQISSGIEPVFMLDYKRRRKVNPNHPNISFIDKNGDCWEEYIVYHPMLRRLLMIYAGADKDELQEIIDNSPWKGSTAYEINPMDRVKIQGTIQKWIDHSISSTINLPEETTEEQVGLIYMEAWKQGCKGITIYRDKCRDGVLVSNDSSQKDDKFVTNNAPKRPKELPCDIFTPTSHGQQYVVAVGILDDKPYEVFAFKWDRKFDITKGIIKKATRGRYDIYDINGKAYAIDITSEMSQIEEDRTRLISWGLRHGAGIKFLVEQLNKAKGNGFQSFSRVIARTLKKYIKDNEKVTGATCENCGSSNLIYVAGCNECKDCGSSKCG